MTALMTFRVDGEVFEFDGKVKLGDGALILDVCGVLPEDLEKEAGSQMVRVTGYLAIAVKRAHPDWTRAEVVRFVEDVDTDPEHFEIKRPGANPPANGAADPETPSPDTSDASTSDPEDSPAVLA